MAEGFGLSFLPGQQGGGLDQRDGRPQDAYQDPVRILSLRLPRILGGSALAPAPLLQGRGGMGSPFGGPAVAGGQPNPIIQALMMMAGLSPQGPGGPMMKPHAQLGTSKPPMPKVIPGIDPITAPMLPIPQKTWTPEAPISQFDPAQVQQAADQSAGGYSGTGFSSPFNMTLSKYKNQFEY